MANSGIVPATSLVPNGRVFPLNGFAAAGISAAGDEVVVETIADALGQEGQKGEER